MELLTTFEEKISLAIERIKVLKEERDSLVKRVKELEGIIKSKDQEIETLTTEKASVKKQIEKLLDELESLELT